MAAADMVAVADTAEADTVAAAGIAEAGVTSAADRAVDTHHPA